MLLQYRLDGNVRLYVVAGGGAHSCVYVYICAQIHESYMLPVSVSASLCMNECIRDRWISFNEFLFSFFFVCVSVWV